MKHLERAPLTTKMEAILILAMLDTKLEKDTYLAYLTLEVSMHHQEHNK